MKMKITVEGNGKKQFKTMEVEIKSIYEIPKQRNLERIISRN